MQNSNKQEPTRRTLLRAGAVAGTATGLGAAGILGARTASAAATMAYSQSRKPPPYPADVTDTSHCTPEVAVLFRRIFTAKSEHDTAAFMAHFSPSNASYSDACLGVVMSGWQAINSEFTSIFASAPAGAISYPLTIVGDTGSAAIEFVDSPGFFGQEIRTLSTITFDHNQKITRWIDYWDRRSSLFPSPDAGAYPTDFNDSEQNADPTILRAAKALQSAFTAGNATAAVALMSVDVVHEDMSAHTYLRGQSQVQRYYTRALRQLPYGPGATLLHTEGNRHGGGYEWSTSPAVAPGRRGHTAIELDALGKISRLTTVYDSSLLSYPAYQALVGLAAETPQS
jgi:hypothetical protein